MKDQAKDSSSHVDWEKVEAARSAMLDAAGVWRAARLRLARLGRECARDVEAARDAWLVADSEFMVTLGLTPRGGVHELRVFRTVDRDAHAVAENEVDALSLLPKGSRIYCEPLSDATMLTVHGQALCAIEWVDKLGERCWIEERGRQETEEGRDGD